MKRAASFEPQPFFKLRIKTVETLSVWSKIALVGVSGGLGAICRYFVMLPFHSYSTPHPGLGTLIVNTAACFLIGIFAGWLAVSPWNNVNKEIFLLVTMVGFCGGFSTFSAFTLDCVKYVESGQFWIWLIFGSLTVFLGLFLCMLGYWLGHKL